MLEDSMKKIVTILENYKVCLQHEITDRAWSKYGLESFLASKAIDRLLSGRAIDLRKEESPYGIPFHFYFLTETPANVVNGIIDYKLDLLREHSTKTEEIGRFGERLVGKIVESIGYDDVEIRKEKHNDKGIGRMDMDVFAKHFDGYYQNIEVKNRRQPVNVNDIEGLGRKTAIARERWNLPIESALVCPFIYEKARKKAESDNIPVVITSTIFVPKKYESFYNEYSIAFGSYYVEVANCETPSDFLTELIEWFILDYEYQK